jgi:hypothetical protein
LLPGDLFIAAICKTYQNAHELIARGRFFVISLPMHPCDQHNRLLLRDPHNSRTGMFATLVSSEPLKCKSVQDCPSLLQKKAQAPDISCMDQGSSWSVKLR